MIRRLVPIVVWLAATAAIAQDGGTPDAGFEAPDAGPTLEAASIADAGPQLTARNKALPAQPVRSRNTVTINPLMLVQREVALEYERALNDWFSVYVAPQPTWAFTAGTLELGFLAEIGTRLFLIGKPPGGLFIGPLVQVALSRESASGVSVYELTIGAGGMLGLSFVFFDRVVVSGGVGARYLKLRNDPTHPVRGIPRLAVGVAF